MDLDSRVYTIQELKSMARRGAWTVKEILEVGVLLAGDRGGHRGAPFKSIVDRSIALIASMCRVFKL